jgi:hypothetical protein
MFVLSQIRGMVVNLSIDGQTGVKGEICVKKSTYLVDILLCATDNDKRSQEGSV